MREPVAKDRPIVNLDEFERRLRQSGQLRSAATEDPLAELARLVGDDKDRYQQIFEEHSDTANPRPRDRDQRNFRDNGIGPAQAALRGLRQEPRYEAAHEMRQEPRSDMRPQARQEARPELRNEPRMPQARPQDIWPSQRPLSPRPEPQTRREEGSWSAPQPQTAVSEPQIRRDDTWSAQRSQMPRGEPPMRPPAPMSADPGRELRSQQRATAHMPAFRQQDPALSAQAPAQARPAPQNPLVGRQPAQRQALDPSRGQSLGGNFAAIEAGLRGSIAPNYRPAAKPPQPYASDYQDDEYDAQDYEPQSPYRGESDARLRNDSHDYYQQDAYPPQYEDDYTDEDEEDWLSGAPLPAPRMAAASAGQEPRQSRRLIYLTAAVVLVGMGGIGIVFASKHNAASPHQIAMIRAATSPNKIQAHASNDSDGGAMQDDSVFDKTPQPPPGGVVSHQEQPVNLAQINADQQNADNNAAAVPVPTPPSVAPPWQTDPNAQPQPAGNANNPAGAQVADATNGQALGLGGVIQSRKVKTLAVRPDGSVVADNNAANPAGGVQMPAMQMPDGVQDAGAGPAPQPQDPATDSNDPAEKTATRANAANPAATNDQSANSDATNGGVAATDAAPKPKAHRVKLADLDTSGDADQATHSGAFAVQLGAPSSEAEARRLMDKISQQYQAEIGGHQIKYHRAKIGDKSVYRVRVGGLSKTEAMQLCQSLQAKGGTCFVAKD